MQFGHSLQIIRQRQGLTQVQLATLVGIKQRT
jgi:DNA-binding XRE family transcriptional regulator